MAPKKKNKHQQGGDDVQTGGGKGRDQYGKKFGKKHASAMMEFTKTLWMQDATTSLRNLLQKEVAQVKMREFLALEYGEAQLDFVVEGLKLQAAPPDQQAAMAPQIYNNFINVKGEGIGQQERTKDTQQLWDYANNSGPEMLDAQTAFQRVMEETESTLGMLAFDAFPRFLKSKYCQAVMADLKTSANPNEVAALEGAINTTSSKVAQDADDWLNMFVSAAESFPACIVISDMTIPGAPMVYINNEFTKTTQYTKEEAVGRNCRFLQGPDTEPESIAVIRNTLSKGQDCHVKLTNYRKNGEKFQNLLSMKPVFDADGIYRYVIGVQFEIVADQGLKKRLVQLDKLLRLLPSRLNLKSKAKARARGKMAAKTTGEVNTALLNKEQVVSSEVQQGDACQSGPRTMLEDEEVLDCAHLNFDGTIFAFTRIMWLNNPMQTLAELIKDAPTAAILMEFGKTVSVVMEGHMEFAIQVEQIKALPPHEKERGTKRMLRVMEHNQLFYCSTVEVVVGDMPRTDLGPIMPELEARQQQSLFLLATDFFPRFLNSKFGTACVKQLHTRELSGQPIPVKTAASGHNPASSEFWLNMFKNMSESSTIGMVVSDMTVPGIPLAYVNEGFKTVTGYDKTFSIGRKCSFLQGPETEGYMNDEIMHALQQHEPLCCKLHNHKQSGEKFQCLLCLHPVHDSEGGYRYCIGVQMEFKQSPDFMRQLSEMERIARLLPLTVCGDEPDDAHRCNPMDFSGDQTLVPRLQDMAAGGAVNTGGPAPAMGMGMGMPAMGGMPGAPGQPAEEEAGDQIKSEITVGGKKNKTHYGKKFGKKHKSAMMEFTKTLWMQDATTSLRNLLDKEVAQAKMREFLAQEYGEAQLDFLLESFRLLKLPQDQQLQYAPQIYASFLNVKTDGIGQQERTKGTQDLWDSANGQGADQADPQGCLNSIKEESERTLGMLAFDAFPRFLKSKHCQAVMADLKTSANPNEVAALEGAINTTGAKTPKDADDWLNMFVSAAESFPACIVISDMTIPGAPMVYINSEFTKTTQYTKEEAVGRNCRFLQGPDTEPESIAVIRNTLSKGQDCHVKLTNYRKNGEKFQNLLSMKPVFDADGIYRYVIGVQFEIVADQGLKKRLVQLDKLLRLLPSRLNLKSKASAQARGALAAKTTGEANTMIGASEQILAAGEEREEQEEAQGGTRPKKKFKKKKKGSLAGGVMPGMGAPGMAAAGENFDGTIFAMSKICWLQDPVTAMRMMLMDQGGFMAFDAFLKEQGSTLSQCQLRFWAEAQQILMTQGPQQEQVCRALHMRMPYNALFYCTTNEIVIGNLDRTSWPPIIQEMQRWQEQSTYFLANDCFSRFLESNTGRTYIYALRQREANGEQLPLRTVAAGKSPADPNFYLEMFKAMSETVHFGMAITDMQIPGLPLAYVNEGFKTVTGHGKESAIGKNARFLTGEGTEKYMTEEIMESLRHGEPLFCKLHNYKADGTKFQCIVAMHPVYTAEGEYKYMIGSQLDFSTPDPNTPMLLLEMARVYRNMPQTTTGVPPAALSKRIQELEAFLAPFMAGSAAPAAAAPGGFGAPAAAAPGGFGAPAPAAAAPGGWGAPVATPAPAPGGWGAAPAPAAAAPGGFGAPAGGPAPGAWGASPSPPMGGAPSYAAAQQPRPGAEWNAAPAQPAW